MQFRNSKEIEKYYREQFSKRSLKGIKTSIGKDLPIITDEILEKEAKNLQKCIQRWIEQYYIDNPESSYEIKLKDGIKIKPLKRTGGLKKALKLDVLVEDNDFGKHISLSFDSESSWGESFIPKKYPSSYPGWKPWLINDGWEVRSSKAPFRGRDNRAGYYEGYNFIEKGIADWKSGSKYAKYIDVKRIVGAEIIEM